MICRGVTEGEQAITVTVIVKVTVMVMVVVMAMGMGQAALEVVIAAQSMTRKAAPGEGSRRTAHGGGGWESRSRLSH